MRNINLPMLQEKTEYYLEMMYCEEDIVCICERIFLAFSNKISNIRFPEIGFNMIVTIFFKTSKDGRFIVNDEYKLISAKYVSVSKNKRK